MGTEFAWIVPLPAVPKVEKATRGLFTTLHLLFQEELKHYPTMWWVLVVLTLVVFIAGFVVHTMALNHLPWTGLPVIVEDSPGNYTVRTCPKCGASIYVWYDVEGGEQTIHITSRLFDEETPRDERLLCNK